MPPIDGLPVECSKTPNEKKRCRHKSASEGEEVKCTYSSFSRNYRIPYSLIYSDIFHFIPAVVYACGKHIFPAILPDGPSRTEPNKGIEREKLNISELLLKDSQETAKVNRL